MRIQFPVLSVWVDSNQSSSDSLKVIIQIECPFTFFITQLTTHLCSPLCVCVCVCVRVCLLLPVQTVFSSSCVCNYRAGEYQYSYMCYLWLTAGGIKSKLIWKILVPSALSESLMLNLFSLLLIRRLLKSLWCGDKRGEKTFWFLTFKTVICRLNSYPMFF